MGEVELRFVHLVIELMGRHSNLILVDDDGVIMESVKRVTPDMSRVRLVLPRHVYELPHRLIGVIPEPCGCKNSRHFSPQRRKGRRARSLVSGTTGYQPAMAREVMFRATGDATPRIDALPDDARLPCMRPSSTAGSPADRVLGAPCVPNRDTDEP
jgi:predicted ribosome quality control (RQC) complex YloA/Tae2 family protein